MNSNFTKNLKPHVEAELALASRARVEDRPDVEFSHLENAHVIGQKSTRWHVKLHCLMLLWAVRQRNFRELFGQLPRIAGAATKTAFGWVPNGNTGGANVSPFKSMPIKAEHAEIIEKARNGG